MSITDYFSQDESMYAVFTVDIANWQVGSDSGRVDRITG